MTTILAVAALTATIPAYLGAIHLGRAAIDFHDRHTDRPSPRPIQARRQPIGAITARPHWEAVDELGPWNPSQHQPMPALLAGEQLVNAVNTGSTS